MAADATGGKPPHTFDRVVSASVRGLPLQVWPYLGQAPSHTLMCEYIQLWEGACPRWGRLRHYRAIRKAPWPHPQTAWQSARSCLLSDTPATLHNCPDSAPAGSAHESSGAAPRSLFHNITNDFFEVFFFTSKSRISELIGKGHLHMRV